VECATSGGKAVWIMRSAGAVMLHMIADRLPALILAYACAVGEGHSCVMREPKPAYT
jgi:hypothetical protein